MAIGVTSLVVPRTASVWPWEEPWGLGLPAIWIVVGGVIAAIGMGWLTSTRSNVAPGILLCLLAISTPVALIFHDYHVWYWRPIFPLLWLSSFMFAEVSMFWIGRARARPEVGGPPSTTGCIGLLVFSTVVTVGQIPFAQVAYHYALPVPPAHYNGDYMGLGLHIVALWDGTVLWLCTGLVCGLSGFAHRADRERGR